MNKGDFPQLDGVTVKQKFGSCNVVKWRKSSGPNRGKPMGRQESGGKIGPNQ